jgi:hypothetical protein
VKIFTEIKKYPIILFVLILSCVINSCATSYQPSRLGVNVKILTPPEIMERSGCRPIVLLYFPDDEGSVNLSKLNSNIRKKARWIFASQVRNALSEVQYLTVEKVLRPDMGEHHTLKITVNQLDIEIKRIGNYITKTGTAYVEMDISEDMGRNCVSKAVQYTAKRQVKYFEKELLPSDDEFYKIIAEKLASEIVSEISPIEHLAYRPVRSGSSDHSESSAKLIDYGDCQSALDILKPYIKENSNDPDALYNAGVAYECLAKKALHENQAIRFLVKAEACYKRLIMARPSEDVSRAKQQVSSTLELYKLGQDKREEVTKIREKQIISPDETNY